ncbi:NUDIX domain-containing protein [Hamadaea sp. NPDC050747]|uniref:NUDIX domain-containing protein n=1 Tax=Hamadaea sp. NPDC050747 TaxID=3155789 RepID=UPI0033D06ECF
MIATTQAGRPAYVVNVEVVLHRDGRWLLIRRGNEGHAAGTLAGPGGKVETDGFLPGVLEATGRREVLEEIGLDLDGVPMAYVGNSLFVSDDGDAVVNVVFAAEVPPGAEPYAASPEEVAEILWLTTEEALAHPACPPWTRRTLTEATARVAASTS